MTAQTPTTPSNAPKQSSAQKRTARIAGWLMLSTFVTAIGALILYDPVLSDAGDFVLGSSDEGRKGFRTSPTLATSSAATEGR